MVRAKSRARHACKREYVSHGHISISESLQKAITTGARVLARRGWISMLHLSSPYDVVAAVTLHLEAVS